MSTSTMESPSLLSPLPPPRRTEPEPQPLPPPGTGGGGGGGALVARSTAGASADADFFEAMFDGPPPLISDHQDALDLLRSGKPLDAAARKAIYAAAEDHTAAVNKKLDLLELEVAHISTVNHALKVQLLHVKARVLAQLIWSTTDTTLVEAEDGRTTRSPAAWSEASALTGAGTIKRCKDAVAEIIGASVAWRCCERVRPDLLAMFSLGSFNMEAFSREARKIISIHLTCSQAGGGLTPVDARITLKNGGVGHDYYASIVDAAIAGSAKRAARSKASITRLRALVRSVHSDPSRQAELEHGLGATAEMVRGALPASDADYAPQLPDEVLAMLTDEERAAAARRPTRLNPTGATTATTPALLAHEPAASPAATPSRATAVAVVAAAARSGHGTKRVASAGRHVVGSGGGSSDNDRGNATPTTRRPRLAMPFGVGGGGGSSSSDGDEFDAPTATPASATAAANRVVVVSVPAPVAGAVVRLGATNSIGTDDDANNAYAAPATALPLFVVPEPSGGGVVVDVVARMPAEMVAFASGLRAAIAIGNGNGDGDDDDAAGGLRHLFCSIATAFDDVQLIAAQLGDGSALAPNRALMKSSERLLALGLGTCFTSCALLHHGGEGASAAEAAADRAAGTTAVAVFLDPEHHVDDRHQHAFELVYGGKQRFQLRHGAVLVSRACGSPWAVVPAAGGNKNKNKRLIELRFFASRRVVSICCGAAAIDGDSTTDYAQLPPCSAAAMVERAVADGAASSRAEALGVFLRV